MGDATNRERMIAIRWQAQGHVEALGATLDHAFPIDETPCFDEVLQAIDEAERQVWGDPDQSTGKPG